MIRSPLKYILTLISREEETMEEKTYTLNIRQTGIYQYEVTIPEIGVKKTAPTLDSALNITLHDIVKHLTLHYLILVFTDQDVDRDGWGIDPQVYPHTELEDQATFEVLQQGFALGVKRRERHLVFQVSRPLTRAQATWLDEHAGKHFDTYFFKDEQEVKLDALLQEARDLRKATAHE
jgi:hypothetical protein